jgi:hypothetical protein
MKQQEPQIAKLRELCLSAHDPTHVGKHEAALRQKAANQPRIESETNTADYQIIDDQVKHDSESELDEDDILAKYTWDERLSSDALRVRTLDEFTLYDSTTGKMVGLDALNDSTRTSDVVALGFLVEPLPESLRQRPAALAPPAQPLPRLRVRSSHPSARKSNKVRNGRFVRIRKPQSAKQRKRLLLAREEAFSRAKVLLDAQKFPFRIGEALDIISLGKVYTEDGEKNRYHTHKSIYPVGFKSVRVYYDVHEPAAKAKYTSEILAGDNGPIFRVAHSSGEPVYEASSSSRAWVLVLEKLNAKRAEVGVEAKGSTISGPEMFGFAHRKVADLMEGLDGVVAHCQGYVFRDMDYADDEDVGGEEEAHRGGGGGAKGEGSAVNQGEIDVI